MKFIFGIVCALFLAGAAEAGVFTYKFEGYPKKAGNCHEIAADLAETWAEATGTKVIAGRCEAVEAEGYVITVRYEAEKAVRPVSTTAPGTAMLDERGLFKTEAECEAALPGESAHFRQATGLEPVYGYCYRERYTRTFPYALRIEGFGTPKAFPRFTGALIFGTALGYSEKSFLAGIRDALLARGVDVRFVSHNSSVGMGRITVFYYAAEVERLIERQVAKLARQEQCTAAVSQMTGFLASHADRPVLAFCAVNQIGGYFELMMFNWAKEPHEYNRSIEVFASYEACEGGRPQLTEYYKTTLKRPVVGSICSLVTDSYTLGTTGKWSLTLFEEQF